jgi:UDP-3-O-[3-hydroxymyristoyl] glucosamine N-acyltransferase
VVAEDAVIGADVRIGPGAVIGSPARKSGALSGGAAERHRPECGIGRRLSVARPRCGSAWLLLGNRVILHPGVVIGADGFGLAWQGDSWLKVPQTGRAILEDDVEVGANTCIDRGALDDTVIEAGAKLDNLIQIAHNCRIGRHTAIAACVGIAGSTRIGAYCQIGGAAMIIGHVKSVTG